MPSVHLDPSGMLWGKGPYYPVNIWLIWYPDGSDPQDPAPPTPSTPGIPFPGPFPFAVNYAVGQNVTFTVGSPTNVKCGLSATFGYSLSLGAHVAAMFGVWTVEVSGGANTELTETKSSTCSLPACPEKCECGPPPCDGNLNCTWVASLKILAIDLDLGKAYISLPSIDPVVTMTGSCGCEEVGGPCSTLGRKHPHHRNNQ
jgi:hypothetical protein